jgi:hypothetical protein
MLTVILVVALVNGVWMMGHLATQRCELSSAKELAGQTLTQSLVTFSAHAGSEALQLATQVLFEAWPK